MAEMSRISHIAFKEFPSSIGSSVYALTHTGLPGVVKIGRTRQWDMRRLDYRGNGGLNAAHVFTITRDYADIELVEKLLIEQLPFPQHKPNEWFKANLSEVSDIIMTTMAGFGYSFRVEKFEMVLVSREFVNGRIKAKAKKSTQS